MSYNTSMLTIQGV